VSRAYPPHSDTLECPRPTRGMAPRPGPFPSAAPSNTPTLKASLSRTILPTLTRMSHTHPTDSSSSNFQLMIDDALDTYKKRTKSDLLAHPLATRLQTSNTPSAIIALLQEQVQGLDQSRSSDERWSKWLDPTVNVLQAFSSILEAGASLVCFRIYSFEFYSLIFM
jgi:hypothetical protein